jgi:fumarate reductase flavoprotein subunit
LNEDLDVLVIGAGACGLCAAIAAHDQGLSTAIVEKMDRPGGNSALSTGSVPAAGSRFQREAGIEDGPENYCRDLMAIAGEADNADLVRLMAQVSAETVEWLIDDVGARLKLVTAYKHIGHSVPRLHAPVSRRGIDLVDDLVAAVEKRNIPIAVGNSARELIVENGAVRGAVIDAGNSSPFDIRAGKTILAVNGFGANRDLVARFCPEIAGARYFGAHGSAGEAVLWGRKLGAALDNMAAYQGYAAVADPHGGLLSWTPIERGGVLVGADARRFGDESTGYSGYARIVLAQGDHAYAIFDQRIFDIAAQEEEFRELSDYGAFKKADRLHDLAMACGLEAGTLSEEIDRYNASAAGREGDAFGRKEFGIAPLRPPYYACRVVPGMFHTQGGLRIDREARVLRGSGEPIPNLHAGGGAAAGISGRSGALGYASGNGLLTAVALGRIAALSAARALRADRQ